MLGDRPEGVLLVQITRVPLAGVDAFRRFEAAVLPLLPEYEARLERRLRTSDGRFEIHIVSFASREALDRYRNDPRRQEHLHLLHESQAAVELVEVTDVTEETVPEPGRT
jgi:hypothetical protein